MTGKAHEGLVGGAATRLACDAVVVMGVSGSGKSTVGAALAEHLGWDHIDADDFHPRHNIDKMRAGTPLTDADRGPWLQALRDELDRRAAARRPVVLACSALKKAYRDVLRGGIGSVGFVYLAAQAQELTERLASRDGHFFPAALIDSQLATLEQPGPEEHALTIPATAQPDRIAQQVVNTWQEHR